MELYELDAAIIKNGQPAKPFLKPAQTSSRKACTSAMIRKLEEEVEKL